MSYFVDVTKTGIAVAGFRYSVTFEGSQELQNDEFDGKCLNSKAHIVIKDGLSEAETSETIIHEILEAIKCQWNVKLEHDDLVRISRGLHQVLTDLGIVFRKGD